MEPFLADPHNFRHTKCNNGDPKVRPKWEWDCEKNNSLNKGKYRCVFFACAIMLIVYNTCTLFVIEWKLLCQKLFFSRDIFCTIRIQNYISFAHTPNFFLYHTFFGRIRDPVLGTNLNTYWNKKWNFSSSRCRWCCSSRCCCCCCCCWSWQRNIIANF